MILTEEDLVNFPEGVIHKVSSARCNYTIYYAHINDIERFKDIEMQAKILGLYHDIIGLHVTEILEHVRAASVDDMTDVTNSSGFCDVISVKILDNSFTLLRYDTIANYTYPYTKDLETLKYDKR